MPYIELPNDKNVTLSAKGLKWLIKKMQTYKIDK